MSPQTPFVLRRGPVLLEWEPWSGWVRRLRVNGEEAVRAVYAAARADNWASDFGKVTVREQTESRVAWDVIGQSLPFRGTGEVELGDGEVRIAIRIEATAEYQTQRTGMCLLHPPHLHQAGGLVVRHGSAEETTAFPRFVSPHQPFFEVLGMRHGLANGAEIEIAYEGEIFETEDQRNWTDASYKTYCRPLDWPKPYPVRPGEQIAHQVTVRVLAEGGPAQAPTGTRPVRTPRLGAATDPEIDQRGMFVDLNRNRPQGPGRAVGFGVHPQVHVFDDRSILENADAIEDAARSAAQFAGTVHVGPVRLGPGDDPREPQALGRIYRLLAFRAASAGEATSLEIYPDPEDWLAEAPEEIRLVEAGDLRVFGWDGTWVAVNPTPWPGMLRLPELEGAAVAGSVRGPGGSLDGPELTLEPFEAVRLEVRP